MGSSDSKEQSKAGHDVGAFSGQEITHIESVFNKVSAQASNQSTEKVAQKEQFVQLFPESREFGTKLYDFIASFDQYGAVTYKTFIMILEILTKTPMSYQLSAFNSRTFEKSEIFLQISTKRNSTERRELEQQNIKYDQFLQFLKELLSIFHSQKAVSDKNLQAAATYVCNSFFNDPESELSWADAMYYINQRLPFCGKTVKNYFVGKFVEPTVPLKLPLLEDESYILNKELLGIFYLSNSFFHSVPKLQLVYSTAKSGTSFNRLAYSLRGYEAPTLILIKHIEQEDPSRSKERKSYVFGGFARSGWSDELKYTGDSENYIFSVMPQFRSFYAYRGQGGTNYMYLNTKKIQNSKYKVGLGFGGFDFKNFRLWLDEELESGSYVSPDDSTYDKGYLVDPSITKFNIEHVEIWGLGDENTLRGQFEYRQREMEIIEQQRKVDKKQFLQSGFDREMFFGNTFKSEGRADQTDFRAEMEKEAEQKKH